MYLNFPLTINFFVVAELLMIFMRLFMFAAKRTVGSKLPRAQNSGLETQEQEDLQIGGYLRYFLLNIMSFIIILFLLC